MRRMLLLILAMLLFGIAVLATGCSLSSYDIDYQVDERVYQLGAQITMELQAINMGHQFTESVEYSFWTALFIETEGEQFVIYPSTSHVIPENVGERVYKKGDLICAWNEIFDIPTDAPIGNYHLKVYVFGEEIILQNVVEITN